ncbi:MAG: hypothetical protein HY511_04635 [Actinobacteria bacterium]|nr:hypothetical protein [Actinomycetota bacterium]
MKYETTPAFDADVGRLSRREHELFGRVLRERLVPAADRRATDPSAPWPKGLRVRDVEGAPGVWELTWSFSGPDGRATFEWVEIGGEPAIRWRRVGGHAIFREP